MDTTFKAFADFRGFEPRLCRPCRAQTKGEVESGVKYLQRNFLAGRRFRDDLDFNEQLQEWMATVADVRVHGTTHERPIDRFARGRDAPVPAPPGRAFRIEAPLTRVVATDYLVTVDANRYSVPFTLIGPPVEVMRRNGFLQMRHRGRPARGREDALGRGSRAQGDRARLPGAVHHGRGDADDVDQGAERGSLRRQAEGLHHPAAI